MKDRILVIDGTYLAYRSYYATMYSGGAILQNSKGIKTNAIVAFFNTFSLLIKYYHPENVFFAFDSHIKTFRHEMFKEYKATRQKAPQDFYIQLNLIQDILTNVNIKNLYKDGFEADDLVAKIVKMFPDNEILIFSADQDLNQLVDNNVSIIKKKNSEYILLTKNNFHEYYDFMPNQVIDYKAMIGDSSDNFKGIPGIGPKTASKLLNKYGTLDEIYKSINELPKVLQNKLNDFKEHAIRDKYLATLRSDFDLNVSNINELSLQNVSVTKIGNEILEDLELNFISQFLHSLEVN
ncbi:5'-3' exonuclease [Metamycoplasma buccale]|uniref:5'-3' exonuclease n=1 Tax=Metamycoplasma buccale TaxID=55602 RepID=UPI00398F3B35